MISENKNIEKENIEDLYHNLKIGLEDVVNGNTRPFSEFISEIKTKDKRRLNKQIEDWETVSKYNSDRLLDTTSETRVMMNISPSWQNSTPD